MRYKVAAAIFIACAVIGVFGYISATASVTTMEIRLSGTESVPQEFNDEADNLVGSHVSFKAEGCCALPPTDQVARVNNVGNYFRAWKIEYKLKIAARKNHRNVNFMLLE